MYQSNIRKTKQRVDREDKNRALITPADDQLFGVVKQMLGNGRVKVYCHDEKERVGLICGAMRNRRTRVIVEPGNVVIVSHRGFEDKIDLLYKYTNEEVAELVRYSFLPDCIRKNLNSHDIAGRDIDDEGDGVIYSNNIDDI